MAIDPIATVFANGRKYLLGRSRAPQSSYFGGPGTDQAIKAPRHGPRRLHHLLTLNHAEFGISALKFGSNVSFYYGLCFEGCELDWTRTATSAIEITRIDPKKSGKDYPYFGYPDLLPYFPLEIVEQNQADPSDMEEAIGNTPWEAAPDNIYVIVHSHPELGIALLSPGEEIDIVFEYDPISGRIRAESSMG